MTILYLLRKVSKEKKKKKLNLCNALKNYNIWAVDNVDSCHQEFFSGDISFHFYFHFHFSTMNSEGLLKSSCHCIYDCDS